MIKSAAVRRSFCSEITLYCTTACFQFTDLLNSDVPLNETSFKRTFRCFVPLSHLPRSSWFHFMFVRSESQFEIWDSNLITASMLFFFGHKFRKLSLVVHPLTFNRLKSCWGTQNKQTNSKGWSEYCFFLEFCFSYSLVAVFRVFFRVVIHSNCYLKEV